MEPINETSILRRDSENAFLFQSVLAVLAVLVVVAGHD